MAGSRGVRAAIGERLAAVAMSADEVLRRLVRSHARASLGDFLAIDRTDGTWRVELEKAERLSKMPLLKKVVRTKYGIAIELHDALRRSCSWRSSTGSSTLPTGQP